MSALPPEIRTIAGDAAKAELLDCQDCRQIGKHVGNIVLQAVAPLIAAAERERIRAQALAESLRILGSVSPASPDFDTSRAAALSLRDFSDLLGGES